MKPKTVLVNTPAKVATRYVAYRRKPRTATAAYNRMPPHSHHPTVRRTAPYRPPNHVRPGPIPRLTIGQPVVRPKSRSVRARAGPQPQVLSSVPVERHSRSGRGMVIWVRPPLASRLMVRKCPAVHRLFIAFRHGTTPKAA
ncbi:hypothetical protein GCM10009753_37730 [Streptantibioticus ferralitis]